MYIYTDNDYRYVLVIGAVQCKECRCTGADEKHVEAMEKLATKEQPKGPPPGIREYTNNCCTNWTNYVTALQCTALSWLCIHIVTTNLRDIEYTISL